MLLRLLTLPVTGPAKLGWWVLQQVVDRAEDVLYDEQSILTALDDLHTEHEQGRITDEEHAAARAVLFDRLAIARARRDRGRRRAV